MDELTRDIIKLAPEFGIDLNEDSNDVEGEVADKLKRAAKIDEVDTITFGLETDDGKIVKVFVSAEDAEKFEKLMADMLGKEDNIESALNAVANEVDIVDVEWPPEEDGDADDVDDDLDDDGSEVLNKKVYDKANLNKEIDAGTKVKSAIEGLTFGERFVTKLNEGSPQSFVAMRMQTPSQQLVYQAILDLGVPEQVLDRTPYRSQVIKNLKAVALELQRNGAMKNALKLFIKRAIADDEKAEKAEAARVKKEKERENKKSKFGSSKDEEKPVDESLIMESVAGELYWDVLEKLLIMVDGSSDATNAKSLMAQSSFKTLINRSQAGLQTKIQGTLMTKFQQLQRALGASNPAVAEAMSPADVQAFIIKLINVADISEDKSAADKVLKTTQMKTLLNRVKATAGSIPSMVKSKMIDIDKLLGGMSMVGEDKEEPIDLQGMHQQAKLNAIKWVVEPTKDGVSFSDSDKTEVHEVTDENLERMVKALSNRESITVKTTDGAKLVVSPRGRAAVIKVVGSPTRIELSAPDVDAVLDAAAAMMESRTLIEATDEPKVPRSAGEWELIVLDALRKQRNLSDFYSSKAGADTAGKKLGEILASKLKVVLALKLDPYNDEDKLLKHAQKIRDEMYKEMNKYREFGARDTEPESHLIDCIERALKLSKYSLDR